MILTFQSLTTEMVLVNSILSVTRMPSKILNKHVVKKIHSMTLIVTQNETMESKMASVDVTTCLAIMMRLFISLALPLRTNQKIQSS